MYSLSKKIFLELLHLIWQEVMKITYSNYSKIKDSFRVFVSCPMFSLYFTYSLIKTFIEL